MPGCEHPCANGMLRWHRLSLQRLRKPSPERCRSRSRGVSRELHRLCSCHSPRGRLSFSALSFWDELGLDKECGNQRVTPRHDLSSWKSPSAQKCISATRRHLTSYSVRNCFYSLAIIERQRTRLVFVRGAVARTCNVLAIPIVGTASSYNDPAHWATVACNGLQKIVNGSWPSFLLPRLPWR
jgi:hypothetical protein